MKVYILNYYYYVDDCFSIFDVYSTRELAEKALEEECAKNNEPRHLFNIEEHDVIEG